MATAKATTDHDEIRTWVEARGGHPARVKSTGTATDPGVLRIDFPGFSGEDTLEEIEWDEFFEWFDRNELALLLSDEEGNRFNKIVTRESGAGAAGGTRRTNRKASGAKKVASSKKTTAKKASAKKSTAKKTSAKKTSAKKVSAKKTSAKKTSAKKTSRKKTSAKKTSAKKTSAKKTAAKKTSAKKASPKKASSKKTSSSKTSSGSRTTTSHTTIRKWVEARGGFPAHVKKTGRKRGDLGVLRIDYPGYSGKDTLERVGWDEWFEAFDRNKLAFLHDNKRSSRFSKLVNR